MAEPSRDQRQLERELASLRAENEAMRAREAQARAREALARASEAQAHAVAEGLRTQMAGMKMRDESATATASPPLPAASSAAAAARTRRSNLSIVQRQLMSPSLCNSDAQGILLRSDGPARRGAVARLRAARASRRGRVPRAAR